MTTYRAFRRGESGAKGERDEPSNRLGRARARVDRLRHGIGVGAVATDAGDRIELDLAVDRVTDDDDNDDGVDPTWAHRDGVTANGLG
jgi:hypothetical protein